MPGTLYTVYLCHIPYLIRCFASSIDCCQAGCTSGLLPLPLSKCSLLKAGLSSVICWGGLEEGPPWLRIMPRMAFCLSPAQHNRQGLDKVPPQRLKWKTRTYLRSKLSCQCIVYLCLGTGTFQCQLSGFLLLQHQFSSILIALLNLKGTQMSHGTSWCSEDEQGNRRSPSPWRDRQVGR